MDIRHFFFRYRSYTPIPLICVALFLAKPSWLSFGGGFILLMMGEGLRIWGVAYAGVTTRTTKKAGGARLITDGPYAHVRNPLYWGNFLLSSGFLIMMWAGMPWMAFIFICLFIFQYQLIVHLEEEYLQNQFQKEYQKYKKNVRRWLPHIKPYQSQNNNKPNFSRAVYSERSTFLSITVVCVLILIRWHFL